MSAPLYQGITDETLEAVKKAQTQGFTSATGLTGYDLASVISLIPVNTPFFDMVPRKTAPVGSKAAYWRALLNVNNQQPNPFTGQDGGGAYLTNLEQDVSAFYQPVRISDFVTRDAVDLGRNYFDVKAMKVTQSLLQWKILENKGLLGGQNFPLPAITAPTVTPVASGGSIATGATVAVKVAARSGLNYYWGGSGVASSAGSATTASNGSSVTGFVTAVRGAVAYDWFVGGFYYTTTVTNTVTITSVPTSNNTVPSSSYPSMSTTPVTAVPTVDASFSAASYNGLFASINGDYGTQGLTTPGTGTASGAIVTSLDGATLTGSSQGVSQIDAMFLQLYNNQQLSPTKLLVSAQQSNDISSKIFGGGNATVYLEPQGNGRVGALAGASVGSYVNKAAGGVIVPIAVDPHMPPGQIAFLTEHVSFPSSGISNVFEARTLRDVSQYDYGTQLVQGAGGGPRDIWDVSSFETFINRAPATCALLTNVASG